MDMDHVKGWSLDLRSIYVSRWSDRERFHLREDLFESPDGEIAALLYAIGEVGVGKEIGRLAIIRRGDLILNCSDVLCWYLYDSAIQFGAGSVLFLHRFESRFSRLIADLCALDHARRQLASTGAPEDFYRVRHVAGTEYALRPERDSSTSEVLVDLEELKWRSL